MFGLRKVIFYIFAIIYLILCPLLVARMLGFVVNPLTHRLVKTGLVYVSTNPPEATVRIDGRLSRQKTPTVVRDLVPGEHFIRIELEGYNDWARNISIIAKKATVLDNVLLIPEEWPIKRISREPYENITPVSNDILFAVKENRFFFIDLRENPPLVKELSSNPLAAPAHVPDTYLINAHKDVLTKEGSWIRLYTKEDFGPLTAYNITTSKPSTNIYFQEKNGSLYYLDNRGYLSVVRILPYRPMLNIPIPDALKASAKEFDL